MYKSDRPMVRSLFHIRSITIEKIINPVEKAAILLSQNQSSWYGFSLTYTTLTDW